MNYNEEVNMNQYIITGGIIGMCVTVGIFLGMIFFSKTIWTGIYYPNKENIVDERTWIVSPPLYSLTECQKWVNVIKKSGENYDYQCSTGCYFTTKYGETTVCKTKSK